MQYRKLHSYTNAGPCRVGSSSSSISSSRSRSSISSRSSRSSSCPSGAVHYRKCKPQGRADELEAQKQQAHDRHDTQLVLGHAGVRRPVHEHLHSAAQREGIVCR